MTINKQALREAAEKAISEEGETWWNEEQLASDYGLALHKADANFIAAANPATVLALLDELEAAEKHLAKVRGYNVDLAEESRQYQQRVAELDNALCELLPGIQYMDPPDGGSVTPLEQVLRMVADYRERLKIAESRCDHRSKFWDVSGVQRCTLCDKAISSDGDQQTADLLAAGIITKVGE